MKQLSICIFSVIWLSLVSALAKDATPTTQYRQILQAGPVTELAAQAAEFVRQAKSPHRATTAVGVTRAAVNLNPALAPGVVSAIARAVPDLAAMAAGTAATEQPKQAAAIAAAAAAAAPSKAGKIVDVVCRKLPCEFHSVAIAVAQTNPGLAREILKAVASAIPELRTGVEKALADYPVNSISVAFVLDAAIASNVGTVTFRLPYIPISDTVRTIPPDTSGEVPTGGREYAKP